MSIKKRIESLESATKRSDCFCNFTWAGMITGRGDGSTLSHCPKCKSVFNEWAKISESALSLENLTDAVIL